MSPEEAAQPRKTYPNGGRPEPLMQVVTRGWWTLKVEQIPHEVLEAEHQEAERKRANRRTLKSLIFGRG